ncbi:tRNA-uridine aminocarboxypropyltransferase [Parendozoicomonas haliclonae]|uniref:tRNA-uridine aminocarboxypropyltransferase n=1 Tax=Parendozoicomonas haliclonae TaxID=1960125 RepID=A0A1X7AU61_9GAMM|nr:tRNA-uridine aminocarboxypropyltransferase [Parendozoicomonas haliclonae]SMA50957.1 DTW domain protein [Parendozoicomonas haliclonae]
MTQGEPLTLLAPEFPHRRPFLAKGAKISRCTVCLMPAAACICDVTPQLDVPASFWLLMHHNEQYKPTNTGRLLLNSVGGGRTIWQRPEPDFRLLHLLARKDRYPVLVYPQAMAPLNPIVDQATVQQAQSEGREPVFILLDSTWQQSRKMYNHSSYLHNLPVLGINPDTPSRYRLRRAQKENHLCTAEVGAECLRWLGLNDAAGFVSDYFDVFNDRYLAARQSIPCPDTEAVARLHRYRSE